MKILKKKKNYDEWFSDLEAWLVSNCNSLNTNYQGIIDEFNKRFVNEYIDNYYGNSEFLDSYFGAINDYLNAVINADKPQKEKLLKQALSKAQNSQKIQDPHSESYGINSLINTIKEALNELDNSSNSTSKNQDS